MKLISYYSDIAESSYYSDHYKRFVKDADLLGIKHHIENLGTGPSYQENCLRKPETIKRILQEIKEPVLWVDIDSKIHKNDFNIFYEMDSKVAFSAVAPVPVWGAIKASPLYFNYSDSSISFLDEWIKRCKKAQSNGENVFDHEVLFTMQHWLREHNVGHNIVVNSRYCVWPGTSDENTIIEMGLSDNEQKRNILRGMNINEDKINWQCRGDTFK
jgi:hypothetical protein